MGITLRNSENERGEDRHERRRLLILHLSRPKPIIRLHFLLATPLRVGVTAKEPNDEVTVLIDAVHASPV